MSEYDFIINLIDVKNGCRQIHFKSSYNKSNYCPGLCNGLPETNTTEKVVTEYTKICYEIMKNILRNQNHM